MNTTSALQAIKAIRDNLSKLERLLDEKEAINPYERRRIVLRAIFWSGNDVRKEDLVPVLTEEGTNSRWIGQQVKIGYLSVIKGQNGQVRYAVTPKAIEELRLAKADKESLEWTKLSGRSFAKDWDSPEDSVYDDL